MIVVRYNNNTNKRFNKIEDIFDDNQLNIISLDCSHSNLIKIPIKVFNLINLQIFLMKYVI